MSIMAKRPPISATAEHLYDSSYYFTSRDEQEKQRFGTSLPVQLGRINKTSYTTGQQLLITQLCLTRSFVVVSLKLFDA